MNDPRCWREVFVSGGISLIIAAVCAVFLRAGAWVWIFPAAVVALVLLKWAVRPKDLDGPGDEPENR